MELRKEQEGVYDTARLRRLSESDDFAELERIIKDIQDDYKDSTNIDRDRFEVDGLGRIYAYEAMQQLLDIVHGTEPVDMEKTGNNNYT